MGNENPDGGGAIGWPCRDSNPDCPLPFGIAGVLPLHYMAVLRAGWWPLLCFAVGRLALVVGAAGALVAYEPLVCGRGSGSGAVV